ncbi:MAG: TolC family protein [Pirellulales bacterium]
MTNRRLLTWLLAFWLLIAPGCRVNKPECTFYDSAAPIEACGCGPGDPAQLVMEEPCVCETEDPDLIAPLPLDPNAPIDYHAISLEEAIQLTLQNNKVLRDLGGTLITLPQLQRTVYDPALAFSNPRDGEEAALSAFDTSFAARSFWENNDREFNNTFIGTGGYLKQDLGNTAFELRKRAATGTQMFVRHLIDYDYNNNVGNRFGNPSGEFQSIVEGEVRQPLLQGAGVLFNQIAGPGAQPGQLNGVLLARARTDISLAEFEAGVRDLVANVENAYWDLYFAYRDLDAKKQARDFALETYQSVAAEAKAGRERGEAEQVGQALEQYWRFEAEVANALNGRTLEGTRTNNGSGGGTSRAPVGVRLAERRLRLIMGAPINGGGLLRPSDEPVIAPIAFDWTEMVTEAVAYRPELRRQRWRIKQMELELIANRNLLLPQLDAVARYRWRGFGEDLLSQSNQQFSSAYGDLATGNYQEWQLGMELDIPLGFRWAHTAVRNAEHALARERAILAEQKRDIVFGLSNAASDVQRAFEVAQAQYNRFQAAQQQVQALLAAERAGRSSVDLSLEAQRRVLDTEILYHLATVDYVLALRNVYYEKGTLLAFNNIYLNEGPSPAEAYSDAFDLAKRRTRPLNYIHRDVVIGCGEIDPARGQVSHAYATTIAPGSVPPSEALPSSPPEPMLQVIPAAPPEAAIPPATELPLEALEFTSTPQPVAPEDWVEFER